MEKWREEEDTEGERGRVEKRRQMKAIGWREETWDEGRSPERECDRRQIRQVGLKGREGD